MDGAIGVSDLPKIAKEFGMSSIALSDHGSLSGSLEFYRECKANNIKPILSMEGYLTHDKDDLDNEQKTRDNYHIILTATNNKGWQNLMYLSTHAYLHNFYYKPRINIDVLAQHSEGLIGTSACLAGLCRQSGTYDEINKVFLDPDKKAEKNIHMFREIFRGNFFLELMDNSMLEQISYNKFLVEMASKLNMKNIITADAHYAKASDEPLHEMLMAMQSKKTIDDYKKQDYFHYENCYLRTPEEMLASAKKIACTEDPFHNTILVSDLCNVEIELGKYKLPNYDIRSDSDYNEYIKGN